LCEGRRGLHGYVLHLSRHIKIEIQRVNVRLGDRIGALSASVRARRRLLLFHHHHEPALGLRRRLHLLAVLHPSHCRRGPFFEPSSTPPPPTRRLPTSALPTSPTLLLRTRSSQRRTTRWPLPHVSARPPARSTSSRWSHRSGRSSPCGPLQR
jgi:hypothetical protein